VKKVIITVLISVVLWTLLNLIIGVGKHKTITFLYVVDQSKAALIGGALIVGVYYIKMVRSRKKME
jgi:uncharacterized membrane protein YciS (DUF1049 family)